MNGFHLCESLKKIKTKVKSDFDIFRNFSSQLIAKQSYFQGLNRNIDAKFDEIRQIISLKLLKRIFQFALALIQATRKISNGKNLTFRRC